MDSANTTTNNHSSNWKNELLQDTRPKIVNKIMDTLQRHMPFTGPDGMNELKKIAFRFEEKVYAVAVDQQDYLRKISLKMLSLRNHVSRDGNSLAVVDNIETGLLMPRQMRNTSYLPAIVSGNGISLPGQPQPQEASLPQNQKLLPQLQHQPQQLQQKPPLLPQLNSVQQELQERLDMPGGLLQQQQQTSVEQQKQLQEAQTQRLSDVPTRSVESSGQTGQSNVIDWQEKIYQKVSKDKGVNEAIFATMRMGNTRDLVLQIIDTALPSHLSVPETKDVESQKHYRRLLFRSFTLLWGTAVTLLGFIAYVICTRSVNSS